MQVAVIGAGLCEEKVSRLARDVGMRIAKRGHILITGGLGGVMEAASQGAKEAGGIVVGILPGERDSANPYVDVAVATGMGHARNAIVVRSSDVVIALPGSYGTLSEIALALKMNRPVVDMSGWNVDGTIEAKDPEEAVKLAEEATKVAKSI